MNSIFLTICGNKHLFARLDLYLTETTCVIGLNIYMYLVLPFHKRTSLHLRNYKISDTYTYAGVI